MRSLIQCAAVAASFGAFFIPTLVSAETVMRGKASFYGHGTKTASGETYNPNGMTAAHRTLPFGTQVRVTDLGSHRSVVVRINDRGPFIKDRIIDVSRGAAQQLGMIGRGVANVEVQVLSRTASCNSAC